MPSLRKELEIVRAAQKLLGAFNISGGSARQGGGGGGSQIIQISLPSLPKYTKRRQNGQFPALIILKITENSVFYFKVLNKIYS
jgi:hypothetical protein